MKVTIARTKIVPVPNDTEGATVEITYLKPGVRSMLESESNQVTATSLDGTYTPVITFDKRKKKILYMREIIKSWENFLDQHNSPLPLTDDSFVLVLREIDGFYEWLMEETDKFALEVEEQEKVAEGN